VTDTHFMRSENDIVTRRWEMRGVRALYLFLLYYCNLKGSLGKDTAVAFRWYSVPRQLSATSQSKIRAYWVLHVLKIGPAGISTHKKCSKGCAGQFEDDDDSDIEHPDGAESDDGDDSDDSEESGCEDAPAEALSEQEAAEEDERLKTWELDDLEAFTNAKILAAYLGVCACCGEERGDHLMHQHIYSKSDALFDPLEGNLVLIPGEPIRVCTRCRKVLMQKKRPRWAHHFPNMDIRFTLLSCVYLNGFAYPTD